MADIKSVFNDETGRWCLWHGDCRTVISRLSDNSVDSIVTDPPYELGFMGKSWDSTGIAYDVKLWRECLRVLKPGGHLLAFGGSRTYHRLACAVEDAGFEIRDQIMWVYGSGFPKSLDVSKAIDKSAGVERKIIADEVSDLLGDRTELRQKPAYGIGATSGIFNGHSENATAKQTAPATDDAKQWAGWGTALKPAHEPIVMARKPLEGTVANNVLKHGTGAINIDASRISSDDWTKDTVLAKYVGNNEGNHSVTNNFGIKRIKSTNTESTLIGRWPANFIHDGSEEVLALFPDSKGVVRKPTGKAILDPDDGWNTNNMTDTTVRGFDDSGSAARFFYCAKASKSERNAGLEELPSRRASAMGYERGLGDAGEGMFKDRNPQKQNFHPTVKPIALMRYLIRMVTPPEGVVLEPFAGSGTTMVAGLLEGFTVYGCELTDDYLPIIQARVQWALNNMDQPGLF